MRVRFTSVIAVIMVALLAVVHIAPGTAHERARRGSSNCSWTSKGAIPAIDFCVGVTEGGRGGLYEELSPQAQRTELTQDRQSRDSRSDDPASTMLIVVATVAVVALIVGVAGLSVRSRGDDSPSQERESAES